MEASRAPLRLVNADTGELHDPGECRECKHKDDVIAGLERDIRGWAARYAELKRDLTTQARQHPMYEDVKALFAHWTRACRHPRSQFTADRFWLMQPFFERHGEAMCKRAIAGAAFDPMTKQRKNGSIQRFDDISLIFRSESHFESFVNRAPRGGQHG
jgi:hypothetical protein